MFGNPILLMILKATCSTSGFALPPQDVRYSASSAVMAAGEAKTSGGNKSSSAFAAVVAASAKAAMTSVFTEVMSLVVTPSSVTRF